MNQARCQGANPAPNPAAHCPRYNAINGAPSCANEYILTEVVRGRWAPDAHVTTDCGAINNLMGDPVNAPSYEAAVAMAINAGADIDMGDTVGRRGAAARRGRSETVTGSFFPRVARRAAASSSHHPRATRPRHLLLPYFRAVTAVIQARTLVRRAKSALKFIEKLTKFCSVVPYVNNCSLFAIN